MILEKAERSKLIEIDPATKYGLLAKLETQKMKKDDKEQRRRLSMQV